MPKQLSSAWRLLREPISPSIQDELDKKWGDLPNELKSLQQIYGLNEEGCGATIGVMPRCDFACQGCYLSESANRVPAASMEEIKTQLEHLRAYLGKWGNLQLTDGEVTLRSEEELVEILKYAKKVELIPMLMTHGDQIRKNPELLKKLMREGGLAEVSFHVDTTQRGRLGDAYKKAKTESELNPLRAEFADLVRQIRKETGLPLRVATTMTITPSNVSEIPELMQFFMKHSDVFRLISFLPVAQVGRTLEGYGGGVTQSNLWENVSLGLYGNDKQKSEHMLKSRWWMGHHECNQFTMGFVRQFKESPMTYHCVSMNTDPQVCRVLTRFFHKFRGITFRADTKLEKFARLSGMVIKAPKLMVWQMPMLLIHLLRSMSSDSPLKQIYQIWSGQLKLERFTIVGHHFMGDEEIKTEKGCERLEQCTFKVAHEGEMVSMCEFNATNKRKDYYHTLSQSREVQKV